MTLMVIDVTRECLKDYLPDFLMPSHRFKSSKSRSRPDQTISDSKLNSPMFLAHLNQPFQAEAEQLRGEAEAFAIEAKAAAEAEQMKKKAEAWKEYKDAAMVDMVLDALPKVGSWVVQLKFGAP